MRGKGVVGQGFPVGKQRAAQRRRKEGDLVYQALRVVGICRDNGHGLADSLFALAQTGQQHRVGRACGAGQGETFADG